MSIFEKVCRPDILEDAQWIWPHGSSTWAACRLEIGLFDILKGVKGGPILIDVP